MTITDDQPDYVVIGLDREINYEKLSLACVATGVNPIFIGKPERIIMEKALELIGLDALEVAMIGDNYFTDILAGIHAGMPTIYIEGGVSTRDEVMNYDTPPTHILKDLTEWSI